MLWPCLWVGLGVFISQISSPSLSYLSSSSPLSILTQFSSQAQHSQLSLPQQQQPQQQPQQPQQQPPSKKNEKVSQTLQASDRVWQYTKGIRCDERSTVVTLSEQEASQRAFQPKSLATAQKALRECGVVVIEKGVRLAQLEAFQREIEHILAPLLESRQRVRQVLKQAIRQHLSLRQLWTDEVSAELLFSQGSQYRERNDGRIDLQFPLAAPFNVSELIFNPFAYPLLRGSLGKDVRLKLINAIVALSEKDGNGMQHWHRDTEVLFPDDEYFSEQVHSKQGGVHLPPYALNMFVPLVDQYPHVGPTEFILGSHQWGTIWADDERQGNWVEKKFSVPAGSIILADYRTIHRGTVNKGLVPRPVIMLVYGREWWTDVVNYGVGDFGGLSSNSVNYDRNDDESHLVAHMRQLQLTSNASYVSLEGTSEQKFRMYKGFAQMWQKSLFRELDAEFKQARPT